MSFNLPMIFVHGRIVDVSRNPMYGQFQVQFSSMVSARPKQLYKSQLSGVKQSQRHFDVQELTRRHAPKTQASDEIRVAIKKWSLNMTGIGRWLRRYLSFHYKIWLAFVVLLCRAPSFAFCVLCLITLETGWLARSRQLRLRLGPFQGRHYSFIKIA